MSDRILYIDAAAGASGDMILGALVDLGVSLNALKKELGKLGSDFRLVRSTARRGGIRGTRIRVATPGDRGHRHWADFERLVRRSRLDSGVKERTLALIRRLFEAEAEVHGKPVEKIHLHELGSLDTLVDIAGAVLGVALLDVDHVAASPVNVGSGFVDTEHGRMTVPAPATGLLLEGAPVFSEGDGFERTTPTGALLVTGLANSFGPLPLMTLLRTGYGLGRQDPRGGRANALRLVLGKGSSGRIERTLVIEATVDDMTPVQTGYLAERLSAAGALDVFLTPVQMKKGRPGVNVTILSAPGSRDAMSEVLFTESTTLGVRA
ncbi:MAG TPA: nickel pincer cofactor biosynthesis protein LarC, partial [Vicinamibacteria bacterium]|nr:nickel pincer cofactor biosynthesis protein LarC [Vicinamibacteria bacterium]